MVIVNHSGMDGEAISFREAGRGGEGQDHIISYSVHNGVVLVAGV